MFREMFCYIMIRVMFCASIKYHWGAFLPPPFSGHHLYCHHCHPTCKSTIIICITTQHTQVCKSISTIITLISISMICIDLDTQHTQSQSKDHISFHSSRYQISRYGVAGVFQFYLKKNLNFFWGIWQSCSFYNNCVIIVQKFFSNSCVIIVQIFCILVMRVVEVAGGKWHPGEYIQIEKDNWVKYININQISTNIGLLYTNMNCRNMNLIRWNMNSESGDMIPGCMCMK